MEEPLVLLAAVVLPQGALSDDRPAGAGDHLHRGAAGLLLRRRGGAGGGGGAGLTPLRPALLPVAGLVLVDDDAAGGGG